MDALKEAKKKGGLKEKEMQRLVKETEKTKKAFLAFLAAKKK
jgi:hypothetical protein